MNRNLCIAIFLILTVISTSSVYAKPLQLQVYVTSSQVSDLFGDETKRTKALHTFNELGITKLYLETVRGGHIPAEQTLIEVRDFFQEQGYEIAGAVATIRGNDFGMASNQRGIWLNYQNPKTEEDLANHFAWIAGIFDEIMIDDFFATDDISEESVQAKGERDWSTYRLELMTDFAQEFVIIPAREVNPNIQLILKFPQWYDRFHKFGYNVVTAPDLFDRIWVGTETRNPETLRFGFTLPTMGFINYSWLKSFAKEKIGGGWFDFGDCTPDSYLMQAYQTVLAGADEMVLFQAGSIMTPDPCLEPLRNRRNAVTQLSAILNDQNLLGSMAYKPPHSEGSDANGAANLYAFDYFATVGLSPVMSNSPTTESNTVLLARQAADDLNIPKNVQQWLSENKTVIMTPDFLAAANHDTLFALAGYSSSFDFTTERQSIDRFQLDHNESLSIDHTIDLRTLPLPGTAKTIIAGMSGDKVIPFLTQKKHTAGQVLVFNIDTFTHEEFAPGKEQFLPPRPLFIKDLPDQVIQRLQQEVIYPYGIQVEGNNNLGLYFYDQNTVVLTNFTSQIMKAKITIDDGKSITLDERFDHLTDCACSLINQTNNESHYDVSIPSWEITVLTLQ